MGAVGSSGATMKITPNWHPHEDVFEDYAFNRLSGEDTAEFEEHLLLCEQCQATLAETDDHIALMKAATAAYVSERNPSVRRGYDLRRNVAAAAILLLTCLTGLLSWRSPAHDPKTVALNAYRGDTVSLAPVGHPLDLQIDLKDVPKAAAYRVEVVDGNGRRVWFGGTPAHIPKGLPKGDYWVRLLTENGEWLREFGLKVGDSVQ